MNLQTRRERLRRELQSMSALEQASSILEFAAEGESPDRYTIVFHGRGLRRARSPRDAVEIVERHECEIRLPLAYPQSAPQIRWLTPLFHPNVSFSGFISVRDIGLPWNPQVGLDVVCERLWDVARLSFMNLAEATNPAARRFFREQAGLGEAQRLPLPLDNRPLRGVVFPSPENLVRYERSGDGQLTIGSKRNGDSTGTGPPCPSSRDTRSPGSSSPDTRSPGPSSGGKWSRERKEDDRVERPDDVPNDLLILGEDTLIIGEDTRWPDVVLRPARDRRPNPDDTDDIFYIGDEE